MNLHFDAWIVFFAFAAANSILLSILLYLNSKENERMARLWLSLLLLLFGVTMAFYVCFWTRLAQYYIHLNVVVEGLPLLFGPILLFYYQELNAKRLQRYWYFHFLPFAMYCAFHLPIWILSAEGKRYFYKNEAPKPLWQLFFAMSNVVVMVSLLAYSAYFIKMYIGERSLVNKYSDQSEYQKLGWERGVFASFALYSLLCLLYYILAWTGVLTPTSDYFVSLGLVVCIYYIAYCAFRPPLFFEENSKKENEYITTKQLIKDTDIEYFKLKLQSELSEKKAYLQKDLKLATLAERIGLSGHQLSYLINREFQMSYPDFVNEYRIAEAKSLLQDPEIRKEKLLRIAYDTGFSNKTSFFNAFKKHTGVSPSEWRDEVEVR